MTTKRGEALQCDKIPKVKERGSITCLALFVVGTNYEEDVYFLGVNLGAPNKVITKSLL